MDNFFNKEKMEYYDGIIHESEPVDVDKNLYLNTYEFEGREFEDFICLLGSQAYSGRSVGVMNCIPKKDLAFGRAIVSASLHLWDYEFALMHED